MPTHTQNHGEHSHIRAQALKLLRLFASLRFNPLSGLLNPVYTLKSAKEVPVATVMPIFQAEGGTESVTYKYYGTRRDP